MGSGIDNNIIIAVVKLQASEAHEATHENCYIFTSFLSCYPLVMKQNVNTVTLTSKRDIAKIVKILLISKNLKAADCVIKGLKGTKVFA